MGIWGFFLFVCFRYHLGLRVMQDPSHLGKNDLVSMFLKCLRVWQILSSWNTHQFSIVDWCYGFDAYRLVLWCHNWRWSWIGCIYLYNGATLVYIRVWVQRNFKSKQSYRRRGKYRTQEFTLNTGSKVWKIEMVSLPYQIFAIPTEDNTLPNWWDQSWSLGPISSPKVNSITGIF